MMMMEGQLKMVVKELAETMMRRKKQKQNDLMGVPLLPCKNEEGRAVKEAQRRPRGDGR
jgi:hypothetical protein